MLVQGHDFDWPQDVLLKHLWPHCRDGCGDAFPPVEGNENWWTIVFLHKAVCSVMLWVGEGCDGKCEPWKAGTRKEPFTKQRHSPTMPFSACAHNKERSEAHILQPHSPFWPRCTFSLLTFAIISLHKYLFWLFPGRYACCYFSWVVCHGVKTCFSSA